MEPQHTILQVANATQKHPNSIRNAINRGELVAVRVGRNIRITESALQAWLRPYVPGEYGVWAKSGITPLVIEGGDNRGGLLSNS